MQILIIWNMDFMKQMFKNWVPTPPKAVTPVQNKIGLIALMQILARYSKNPSGTHKYWVALQQTALQFKKLQ
jgi:hypothetical protein